ncbi:hypothetical protein KKE60_05140 [Patescibacteria group bacterium]|nr:hypothetical protein [Patescibacteria group bacterium]
MRKEQFFVMDLWNRDDGGYATLVCQKRTAEAAIEAASGDGLRAYQRETVRGRYHEIPISPPVELV